MRYAELEKSLNEIGLDLESFANAIGLKERSISTNYKNKPIDLPKYYIKLLNLYIQFQNEKTKNTLLEEKQSSDIVLIDCNEVLNKKAKEIVHKKCLENNITISEYLSSLVISNL
ncbi:hypothetical protein KJ877_00115 [bacterium]|nr:hypothetical protein [bacterium]MBU1991083.1 hypothetical protein [bacterium]